MQRFLPIVILTLSALAAAAYLYATRPSAARTVGPSLADLERTIANTTPTAETWLAYAQALHAAKRLPHAVLAYQKVLEDQPYHRVARTGAATALAQSAQPDRLAAFLRELVLHDPKLALELLDQPDIRPALFAGTLLDLQKEARLQMMD